MATFNNPRKTAATATASATLARGFHTPVDATSGALTMTLPNTAPAGVEISVEKVDASANAVTASGTIRGAASTITLDSQFEARTFLSEGNGSWRPLSDHRTATSLNAAFAPRRNTFDITNFGAKAGLRVNDASITSGSNVLHSASYTFKGSDVGKVVGVRGAGIVSTDYSVVANDGVLVATVTGISGGDALLSGNAVTTCTGAPAVVGPSIDTALSNAIAAATAAGGGTVYFPAGVWIAQATQLFGSRVSFAGAGRGITQIYVTKVVTATDLNITPWIRASGLANPARYDQVNLSDFTVDGSFFAATDGYTADMKMIHIARTSNSSVERIESINNPATAIGYDNSTNCLIAKNIIRNPGRLAQVTSDTGSAGGSGIGVAVGGVGDLSMVIRDNYVTGLWTATGGTGRSGINIEAASGTGIPATYEGGIHIRDNFVEGMFNGIVDSGGAGTIVSGNTVRHCTTGIKAGTNGITNGSAARDMLITGNVVENAITAVQSGTTYTAVGIVATSSSSNKDTRGRTLITSNVVRGSAGNGIRVVGGTNPIEQVHVTSNVVRDSGLFGIQIAGSVVNEVTITNNHVSGSGQSGASGDGIDVQSGTGWTGGRIENNELSDLATVPTQTNAVDTTGATLTNVKIAGNTGDPTNPFASYARKNSTTTITNTQVLATATAMSLPAAANSTYRLSLLIEYTSSAAAGAKFALALPSGTTAYWTLSAPGAPTTLASATGSLTASGVDGAASIVARIEGTIVVGATAGTVVLQAAQNTATADTLTITTKTNMELRKVA